jgi:hypothetical protein
VLAGNKVKDIRKYAMGNINSPGRMRRGRGRRRDAIHRNRRAVFGATSIMNDPLQNRWVNWARNHVRLTTMGAMVTLGEKDEATRLFLPAVKDRDPTLIVQQLKRNVNEEFAALAAETSGFAELASDTDTDATDMRLDMLVSKQDSKSKTLLGALVAVQNMLSEHIDFALMLLTHLAKVESRADDDTSQTFLTAFRENGEKIGNALDANLRPGDPDEVYLDEFKKHNELVIKQVLAILGGDIRTSIETRREALYQLGQFASAVRIDLGQLSLA